MIWHDDMSKKKTGDQNNFTKTPSPNQSGNRKVPPLLQQLAQVQGLNAVMLQAAVLASVFIAGIALIGVAQRIGWIQSGDSSGSNPLVQESSGDQRYICPMMCVPPTSEPGRCPVCGMEMVQSVSGGKGDGVSISIEPAHRRLIGVRTAMAKMDSVSRTIRTIGSIQYDQSKLSTISSYVDGRMEKLYADYVGVPVSEGDDLALIYSPELYTAQAEFLTSLENNSSNQFIDNLSLQELATNKLFELGMSESQVETLRAEKRARSRIRVKAPQNGTVIEKMVVEGDYLKTGQKIYRVADLSTVWMMLDLFPDDAARVLFGQEVEAEISSTPGVVYSGRVAFIDPTVDPVTRAVRVRVEMLNFDGKLRPGDYATALVRVPAIPSERVYDPALAGKYISPMHPQVIRDTPGPCPICDMDLISTSELGFSDVPLPEEKVVTIPRNAVLMAGSSSVVYVEVEPGRFEVRQITLGTLTEREAIVAEGLEAGEWVATNGNFLLDSQSQLVGNPSLLDARRAPQFPAGPLRVESETQPVVLRSNTGAAFDKACSAYFEIQASLAKDVTASPIAVNTLIDGLVEVLADSELSGETQRELQSARRSAERLTGEIEDTRIAFRSLSHSMIKSFRYVRGGETENGVHHFYCPMVPGGGGDWLQADTDLRNPYWGAEMLTCGELVEDLSLSPETPVEGMSDDPFEGLEVQSLDFED